MPSSEHEGLSRQSEFPKPAQIGIKDSTVERYEYKTIRVIRIVCVQVQVQVQVRVCVRRLDFMVKCTIDGEEKGRDREISREDVTRRRVDLSTARATQDEYERWSMWAVTYELRYIDFVL